MSFYWLVDSLEGFPGTKKQSWEGLYLSLQMGKKKMCSRILFIRLFLTALNFQVLSGQL